MMILPLAAELRTPSGLNEFLEELAADIRSNGTGHGSYSGSFDIKCIITDNDEMAQMAQLAMEAAGYKNIWIEIRDHTSWTSYGKIARYTFNV